MQNLTENAGGDAPKPESPDASSLEEIRLTAGNEQLLLIYNLREELGKAFDDWSKLAAEIEKRWQSWLDLKDLLSYAGDIKVAQEIRQQTKVIEDDRLLLNEPDPILPLTKSLEDSLRKELIKSNKRYISELDRRIQLLETDASWKQLSGDKQNEIRKKCDIMPVIVLSVASREALIKELDKNPIHVWKDRFDALAGRFTRARELAAKELEPETQMIEIPRRTIKTQEDIDAWLKEIKAKIEEALRKGPVLLR